MQHGICSSFLFAICALAVSAAPPTISQVLVKPDNPVRGGTIQFVVLGDFDAKTVAATLFGPAPCGKGCELKINGDKRSDRLTGSAPMDYAGEFQIEVRNSDEKSAKRMPFCNVAAPRITRMCTKPDPIDAGSPFEVAIVGEGFDPASITAVLANTACVKNTCASINLVSKSFDYLAGSAPAVPGGRYIVAVKNAKDTQFTNGDLTIPPKLEQPTIPSSAHAKCSISGFLCRERFLARSKPHQDIPLNALPEGRMRSEGCEHFAEKYGDAAGSTHVAGETRDL